MASRSELILWLNSTLQLNYTKVEQCGSGAAYCQLMDVIYGGVPVAKVKFDTAHGEYDYRHNFKILQASFTRNNITKVIDVEKLIKCRLQDNLELLQWFRKHWMDNIQGVSPGYDPKSRRKILTGGNNDSATELNVPKTRGRSTPLYESSSRNVSTSSTASIRSATGTSSNASSRRSTLTGSRSSIHDRSHASSGSSNGKDSNGTRRSIVPSGGSSTVRKVSNSVGGDDGIRQTMQKQIDTLQTQLSKLTEELKETTVSAESLETERNFYFNKLRDIEILTQNIKDGQGNDKYPELTRLTVMEYNDRIQEILYYTEEGFHISETTDEMDQDIDIEDEMF